MTTTADLLAIDQAEAFARVALGNVVREYPAKQDHVLADAADVRGPRELHPAFYGSFDWHSCVHMHWLLARVRRLFPRLALRGTIETVLDLHLTPANIAAECAYFARPQSRAFERTYGWAWLLELDHEFARADPGHVDGGHVDGRRLGGGHIDGGHVDRGHVDRGHVDRGHVDDDHVARWRHALAPLADAIAQRYLEYLPHQRHPIRYGVHANSAFGLAFALDWARAAGHASLTAACSDAALRWFGADRAIPTAWEPSGIDFLSPALMEADLMHRVLDPDAYDAWLADFLPGLAAADAPPLFTPATVDDRSDGYIVHLDGLNLSRAWNLRGIVAALAPHDARIAPLRHVAAVHLAAGLDGIGSDDYGGLHWLATFATLALTAQVDAARDLAARLAPQRAALASPQGTGVLGRPGDS